ncbi:siroheme synthase [Sporanaerobium hydrogeniformans]|uniref:Siroheme synthase n=1 Tax=Sporanaerobium hydrogeniformans TaxID=3072179 RepID=A0AC61DFX2_9FIRM|nr:bifunctional precorrin-2 dehydrogenase/sirohydrochlorin ferrochelatase [Sporanaerobium hydrogeniformans]PHV71847.1 siroheme synthase [Sporanaerobium hydrogeniformans]
MYYPMMLKLQGKKVIVFGGGKVAYGKAKGLLEAGACVQVISPQFDKVFEGLHKQMTLIEGYYEEVLLQGCFLVVAATNHPNINEQIGKACEEKGILCNVVSSPSLSSFIVPSVVRRGEFVLSISTGGNSPALAKHIKKELAKRYDEDYGAYVTLLGEIRKIVLAKSWPEEKKQTFLRELSNKSFEECNGLWESLKRNEDLF